MRNPFRTVDDVLRSALPAELDGWTEDTGLTRVLKSTRLEDHIYADLRSGDEQMDGIEAACVPKLATFPDLNRDLYQSIYSLSVRANEEEKLSGTARRFNKHILDTVIAGEDYPVLKAVCEGRELPAYDGLAEFSAQVAKGLDGLLADAGGDKNALNTLETLEQQREQLAEKLQQLLEHREQSQPNPTLDEAVVKTAAKLQSKAGQAENVSRMVAESLVKNRESIRAVVVAAASKAAEKAEETATALLAWGGDPADPKQVSVNRSLLGRLRGSETLMAITRQLGRMREIVSAARKNSYAFGRGEKYSIELGRDLNHLLSSEYALLALPETAPLFCRKYQNKSLKQYQRREPIKKGRGDLIFCLDESGSTEGENAAWGKALALTMLGIAARGGRKFALVHFASRNQFKTDLFLPGQYGQEEMLRTAECFLNGGTNFETPITEALRLMEQGGFQKADVVFVTDGACALPELFLAQLRVAQAAHRFTVTGILLDQGDSFPFSLAPFCAKVYRTSELAGDAIATQLAAARV